MSFFCSLHQHSKHRSKVLRECIKAGINGSKCQYLREGEPKTPKPYNRKLEKERADHEITFLAQSIKLPGPRFRHRVHR